MVALTTRRVVWSLIGAAFLAFLVLEVRDLIPLPHVHRPPPPVPHPVEEDIPGHPTPESIDLPASVHFNFNVPASRVRELKAAFAAVGEAYTNGQYEVARRRLAEVPEDFLTLLRESYEEVIQPLRAPHNRFLYRRDGPQWAVSVPPLDFTDVAAFTSYMRLNFELTRFFNDAGVKRGRSPRDGYESNMLYQLKRYREKFRAEGKAELERAAKAFYDEWCEQIESKDGYTRRYLWSLTGDYLYTRKHRPELWVSNRQILNLVRNQADGLVKFAGYKPKWLDEEFPPPPPEEESTPPKKDVQR